MKQIILEKPGELRICVTEQTPRVPGEALIQIARVGVCGSDFHAFNGRHPAYTYPRVIGHEVSGLIVEVPNNDRGLKVGDRCAVDPYLACGQCSMCIIGRTNCCEKLRLFGIHIDGGMQEFLSVPLHLLHRSDKLSLEELALVETLGIGAHAVSRANVKPGERVLVVGAGPIGVATAVFAKAGGAEVHVIEKKAWRRSLVESQGITASESLEGEQAEVVFDATGDSIVMGESLRYVAPGGKMVFVGLTSNPVCIDDALLHRREMTLFASRNSVGQFPRIIRLLEEGKINTSTWVTDRMTLEEVPKQFPELLQRQHLMKAIVEVCGIESSPDETKQQVSR